MAKEFCRNRAYETKLISRLPHEYSFADGSKTLVVDYATTDQLHQCRKMIEEAALRGDNVGVDEYGNDRIESLFNSSEIFQASDPKTGRIQAFLLIQPYHTTYDQCTATVYVFRDKDVDDKVYAELMSLVADFAKAIDAGYTQCFTHVALCLHGLYTQLRRKGFLAVAVLPNWVNVKGAIVKDNAIMFKDFGMPDRQARSHTEVLKMLKSRSSNRSALSKHASTDIRQIPGLPRGFLLDSGLKISVRNAGEHDFQLLYEMLLDAEEKGRGYSVHEFPSFDAMRAEYLPNGCVVALEEEDTNKLIGFLAYRDSALSRSGKGKVLEAVGIIVEGYRKKGFMSFLVSIYSFLTSSLGHERLLLDTFYSNGQMLKLFRNDNAFVCGVLPKCGFQKGVGWVDLVLCVNEVDNTSNGHLDESTKSRL